MTYTSLCVLRILGWIAKMTKLSSSITAISDDNLSRVNRAAIFASLKVLQRPDGRCRSVVPTCLLGSACARPCSFTPTGVTSSEQDVRFVYCAAAICVLLEVSCRSWSVYHSCRSCPASQCFHSTLTEQSASLGVYRCRRLSFGCVRSSP